MDQQSWLTERFEENRPRLRGMAYRMLGSLSEADDAVQDAWLRLSRADTSDVENLRAWLTYCLARPAARAALALKSKADNETPAAVTRRIAKINRL